MTEPVCAHPRRIDSDIALVCETPTINVPAKCRRAMVGPLEILSPCFPGSALLRPPGVISEASRTASLRLFMRRRPATFVRRSSCEPTLS
jgi:hypothetical protein